MFKSTVQPAPTLARHYADVDRPAGFTYPISGNHTLFVTFTWLIGPRYRGRDSAVAIRKREALDRAELYGEVPENLSLVPASLN